MLSATFSPSPTMGDLVLIWGPSPSLAEKLCQAPHLTSRGWGLCLRSDPVGDQVGSHRPGYSVRIHPCHCQVDVLRLSRRFLQAYKVSSNKQAQLLFWILELLREVEKAKESRFQSLLGSQPGLASYSVEILGESFSNAGPQFSNQ